MNSTTPRPAQIQFPGLLAALVNDALQDGVPLPAIVTALELTKSELVFNALLDERMHAAGRVGEARPSPEPLIIPFGGFTPSPKGDKP